MLSKEEMILLENLLKEENSEDLFKKIADDQKQLGELIARKEKTRKKIAEGMKRAKENGVRVGRKRVKVNQKELHKVIDLYEEKHVSSSQAAAMLDISKSAFLKLYKEQKVNKDAEQRRNG